MNSQWCPICGDEVVVLNPTKAEDLYCDKCNDLLNSYDARCPQCDSELIDAPGGGVKCSDPECNYWFCY